MSGYTINPEYVERLRALARGFIAAKRGRDWPIHSMNELGVSYQKPDGAHKSSAVAMWWEILVYAETGEVPADMQPLTAPKREGYGEKGALPSSH